MTTSETTEKTEKSQKNEFPPSVDEAVRKKLNDLHKPEPWHFAFDLVLDFIYIISAVAFGIYFNNIFSYIFAIWVFGFQIHAIGVMNHENQHLMSGWGGPKKIWVEELLSAVTLEWWLGVIPSANRVFHLTHHKYTKTPKDPELTIYRKLNDWFDLPLPSEMVWTKLLKKVVGLGPSVVPEDVIIKGLKDAIPTIVCHLSLISILFYFGGIWLLLKVYFIWIAGVQISFQIVFQWRILCEHIGLPILSEKLYGKPGMDTHRLHFPWYLRWVVPHNIWYHYEHHIDSRVPYYNLPKVREILHPEVPIVSLTKLFSEFAKSPNVRAAVGMKPLITYQ